MKNFFTTSLALLGLVFFFQTKAQEKKDWRPVDKSSLKKDLFANKYQPKVYKLFELDEASFKIGLENVVVKNGADAISTDIIFSFPNAYGKLERYTVAASTVMDPLLAAKYPNIKSFVGHGIDDPSSTIHFDFSPMGFHAMILSCGGATTYIDPVKENEPYYMVFSKDDAADDISTFKCLTPEVAGKNIFDFSPSEVFKNANDGKLRTYRLALACTGEYAQYFLNGTEKTIVEKKAKVLSAMVTLMVKVNAIFERDFGVHMNLVANNDVIIYLTPAADPWVDEWNSKTIQTIESVIGSANYDIGHLLHKKIINDGIAGAAGVGVVGKFSKASGYSSSAKPDLIVGIVLHEMGHQFGANHTFTAIAEPEGPNAKLEVGLGATIMGYGIVTYDYFHAITIQEVTNYIKSLTCGSVKTMGNAVPIANAGKDYIIPKSTPFVLAGVGTDANLSDVKSYAWEQMDKGVPATSIPKSTATSGPAFVNMPLSNSPKRVFPELYYILTGGNGSKKEVLPSVERVLNFRFTVRDNHFGGGSNNSDDVVVNVSNISGPFIVTAPNKAVIWTVGSPQTITWDVANTTAVPVSCANVKISLSTDGGATFPTVLVASTPNDGSYSTIVPNKPTIAARIKVEAVGNIFFDIGNKDFTIAALPTPPCPDIYEPNNMQNDSKLIPVNTNISAKMYPVGDQDFYKFTTTDNAPGFKVSLTNLPLDCDVILLDNNFDEIGTSLNGGLENEFIEYNEANHGATYYLQIFVIGNVGDNKNCYTLRVSPNNIISFTGQEKNIELYSDRLVKQSRLLKIYPNPAYGDQLHVQFLSKGKGVENVSVVDLAGKILFSQLVNVNEGINRLPIKLPSLVTGMYFVKVGNEVARFTVQ